jgi:CHASE2 domain-containing sensor protein
VVGLLIGLLAAVLVLTLDAVLTGLLAERNPFQTIELKTYDWRMTRTANPSTARKDIALVEIDEYSLQNLEPLRAVAPRSSSMTSCSPAPTLAISMAANRTRS